MAIRTHETDGSFADHMANHSAIAVLSEPGNGELGQYMNGELGQYMVDWFTPAAMPVIAKILMDLDLTKRNIGLVILSAGVVDDTTGWIMLSVIVGIASRGGVNLLAVGRTLGLVGVFLLASAFVLYPLLRFLIRIAQRFKTHDGDLAIVIKRKTPPKC